MSARVCTWRGPGLRGLRFSLTGGDLPGSLFRPPSPVSVTSGGPGTFICGLREQNHGVPPSPQPPAQGAPLYPDPPLPFPAFSLSPSVSPLSPLSPSFLPALLSPSPYPTCQPLPAVGTLVLPPAHVAPQNWVAVRQAGRVQPANRGPRLGGGQRGAQEPWRETAALSVGGHTVLPPQRGGTGAFLGRLVGVLLPSLFVEPGPLTRHAGSRVLWVCGQFL